MAKTSHDALLSGAPDRRPYVLTRSGNVGTFKYAASTWTGDNSTSWSNLRGSQAIQLNAGLSLMQSTGSDVGGFGGPLPSPELFVRWVQLGVTHARFCIHSYKPNKEDPQGVAATNLPWMVRLIASWSLIRSIPRYCQSSGRRSNGDTPTFRSCEWWPVRNPLTTSNSLMWESHLKVDPTNAPLQYGGFSADPVLYSDAALLGFDAWIGTGQLLSCPALHEGMLQREVYFPKSSPSDKSLYFDMHAPHGKYAAGSIATISTPLEHMGLFAREGSVIPIGKDCHTVTEMKGPGRTTPDGVDVVLESDGGVVGLDDWRGVEIFPGIGKYKGSWTEDDGISLKPAKTVVLIEYEANEKEVKVQTSFTERSFNVLWGKEVRIVLPMGDTREVVGAKAVERYKEREVFVVDVA